MFVSEQNGSIHVCADVRTYVQMYVFHIVIYCTCISYTVFHNIIICY